MDSAPITFAFIHGGGDVGWAFHLVEAELRARGHHTVAPDLPIEDAANGLEEYAAAVIEAVGDAERVVVVGHSFGGQVAPIVAARRSCALLVYLAGMVPQPGESFGDWWANTGYGPIAEQVSERDGIDTSDDIAVYLHDVDPELAAESLRHSRPMAGERLGEPWPLAELPDVPTRALIFRDDRCFPAEFMRAMVADRLGFAPDEMPGSHCAHLSRPAELAGRLEAFVAELP